MILKGTFKDFDDLLTEYNAVDDGTLDQDFKNFLLTIAGQETMLVNYNPLNTTFDASLIVNGVITVPDGRQKAYMENLGTNLLDSTDITGADEYIYCKSCGLVAPKDLRYDYEPKFTYGDIFDGNCESNSPDNVSGTLIITAFCEHDSSGNATGRMKCKGCQSYSFFEEVQDTF
jgi:hypothetical protein